MTKQLNITSRIVIRGNKVFFNGETIFSDALETNYGSFIRNVYKSFNIDYPKFYKMDNLSKLALVTAELLFKQSGLAERIEKNRFGVFIENSSSSLETDLRYQKTIDNRDEYFPNPSLFVYTLPNVMIGEICIKNNLKGENALFVFDKFAPGFLVDYIEMLNAADRISGCIAGWVNIDNGSNFNADDLVYDSFLFTAEEDSGINPLMSKLDADLLNNFYLIQ